jgi:O-antigen ligase
LATGIRPSALSAVVTSDDAAAEPRAARRGALGPGVALGLVYATGFATARLLDVSEDGTALALFGASYALLVLLCAFFRPRYYLPLVVAYLPFCRVYPLAVAGMSGVNLVNFVIAAGLLAWLTSHADPAPRVRLGAVEVLAGLFVLAASLSVLPTAIVGSRSPEGLAITYRNWLAPILFFFIARGLVRDRRDVAGVLQVLAWTVFLVAACTWQEGVQRGDRGSIAASRVGGLLEQANSMGAFLAYYGVPLLAFALTAGRFSRALPYLAAYLIAARAVLFTFSRGAYLAYIAGSSAVLVVANPLLLAAAGAAGIFAAVLYPPLLPSSVRDRLGSLTLEAPTNPWEDASTNLDRSASHRTVLWRGAARIITEYPVQGIGLGHFPATIDLYTPEVLQASDPRDAHNAYLLIASEMGVPTLLLLLVFLSWLAATALRVSLRRRNPIDRRVGLTLLGTLGSLVVSCMLGSRFSQEALIAYFWILAALLAVVAQLRERRPRPPRAA